MVMSDGAREWLNSLDPTRRSLAREWLEMDSQEAQGRTAIGMVDLRIEMHQIRDEIIAEIRQGRSSPWRSIFKAGTVFGAGVVAGVAAFFKQAA